MIFKSIFLIALAFVSIKAGPLFEPCKKDDLQCLSSATDSFMSKTYGGVPDLGIKPIDPLIIPSLQVTVDDQLGLVFHFENLNVTGLRNLKTADFEMNTDQKSVLLKLKADLNIVGEVEIKLTKSNKSLKGHYAASASFVETSKYTYSFNTVNDTEYFKVGPETNSCEISDDPKVTIGSELQNSLNADKDAAGMKEEYESKKVSLRKHTLCKIGDTAFKTVIHNLRESASHFPKSYFFVDI